jgi:hypothetical protein
MLGFKGFRHAAITLAGIELMHRIRKGQFGLRRLSVQVKLRPLFGTRCWQPEVSTRIGEALVRGTYLQQSPLNYLHGGEPFAISEKNRARVLRISLMVPTP